MECRVKPYNGTEARTAIIHVSDDDVVVFPFIERLSKRGLRVWHDSDIRRVMVEYKRNWKEQQALCTNCLVYLTQNAVNNHVFRERLTNAVENGKPFIVINTLAKDALSLGMRLQIEKAASVIQSNYIPAETLTEKIISLPVLKVCVGKADPQIEVSAYPNEGNNQEPSVPEKAERSFAPSDRTMMELRGTQRIAEPVHVVEPEETKPIPYEHNNQEVLHTEPDSSSLLDETIRISDNDSGSSIDLEATIVPRKIELPIIVSLMSGEKKKGMLGESIIGRTKKIQSSTADISFTDDCKLFSGKHFSLIYIDNMCILICKHPNGMNVNGQEMQEGERLSVESEAIIQIPSNATLAQFEKNEVHPSYLIVASGKRAQEIWDAEAVAFLQSIETGEIRPFTDQFSFGRGNAWKTGVMASRNISRNHGSIALEEGHFIFHDHSTNGTLINGTKISNDSLELNNDDIISVLGDDQNEERFIFHSCFFEKG